MASDRKGRGKNQSLQFATPVRMLQTPTIQANWFNAAPSALIGRAGHR